MKNELVERFLNYVAISSQSNADATTVPSSTGQMELAKFLKIELEKLGLENIILDEHAILTATLKANTPNQPIIGFCAHLDTVDVGLSPDIKPQILKFEGNDLVLNSKESIVFKVDEHPYVKNYLGEEIIFSDGTSVLGADDKAAIASIITALTHIKEHKHGEIKVAFVPDEEIGLLGAKVLPLDRFKVDFAYTIDCCVLGELVYETFNAASAFVDIEGVSAHPMNAKGILVNPLLIASDIIQSFDKTQTPECTEGKEGYIWQTALSANALEAKLQMAIRDHDKIGFEAKKEKIKSVVEKARLDNPKAKINLTISDTYANIFDSIDKDNPVSIDRLKACFDRVGVKPNIIAMRGGTDGSYLSSQGIPTPNYFTGAHNFHSKFELLPISSFEKSYELTLELMKAQ